MLLNCPLRVVNPDPDRPLQARRMALLRISDQSNSFNQIPFILIQVFTARIFHRQSTLTFNNSVDFFGI